MHIGASGLQPIAHVLQQGPHCPVVQGPGPFLQGLDKSAHVGSLEVAGQVGAEIHAGNGVLRALSAVADDKGYLVVLDANAVYGQTQFGRSALNVEHGGNVLHVLA